MSVRRQQNWISQQRVDTTHIRSIESAVANDFDEVLRAIITGVSAPYVIRGFEINMAGSINSAANGLQLIVADGAILHGASKQAGTFYVVPSGTSPEILNSTTNSRVDGAFTPNAINYIGIEYERVVDDATADQIYLWNPTTKTEVSKTVPLAKILRYRIVITTSVWASNVLPIARVTTDPTNNVVDITDQRPMLYRLGSAGSSSPNPFYSYPWTNQSEGRQENPVTSNSSTINPFRGGDKMILNLKEWMDAVMSSIKELKGTSYWYSTNIGGSTANLRADLGNTIFTSRGFVEHSNSTPGRVTWSQDVFIRVVGSRVFYKIEAHPSPGSNVTLAEDQAAYINLVRGVTVAPNLIFSAGSPIVTSVGTVSWTTGLEAGDWIKLASDDDTKYYQISSVDSLSQITLTENFAGTSTGSTGAKAQYSWGVYRTAASPSTDRHVRIALRKDVPSNENMFWLFLRSDNTDSVARVYARFAGQELEQGERIDVNDNSAKQITEYIGSLGETDSSPLYSRSWDLPLKRANVAEVTSITLPAASSITSGQYFTINSGSTTQYILGSSTDVSNKYYVWFNKASAGGNPGPFGRTPIQVNIGASDTSTQVAEAVRSAINAVTDFTATRSSAVVTVTNTRAGYTNDAANVNVSGISISTTTQGFGFPNYYVVDSSNLTLGIKSLDEGLYVTSKSSEQKFNQLFQDRNFVLTQGGIITFTGTSVTFTEPLRLEINNSVTVGASPLIVDLGSTTRTVSATGRMIYAIVNRIAGTATVTDDAATLPDINNSDREVFLIAKRQDAGDGTRRLYFRNGVTINENQAIRLGSSGVSVDANGDVGISTTSPTATSGGLDIASGGLSLVLGAENNSNARTNATTKLGRIGGYHYTNTEEPISVVLAESTLTASNITIGGGSGLMNAATSVQFYTAANTTTTTGTERMRIDSAGQVLVGTNTATNSHIFDQAKLGIVGEGAGTQTGATITGYSGTTPTARPIVLLQRSRGTASGSFTPVASGDALGSLIFRGTDGGGFAASSQVRGEVDGTVSSSIVPGRLLFLTSDSSGVSQERLRIDSAGNVTIGSGAASTYFHLKSRVAGDSPTLRISNDSTAIGNPTLDLYRQPLDFVRLLLNPGGSSTTGELFITHSNSPGFVIRTSTDGTTKTERLRIDTNGNVGIATGGNASSRLHVVDSNSTAYTSSSASLVAPAGATIRLGNTAAVPSAFTQLLFQASDGAGDKYAYIGAIAETNASGAAPIVFGQRTGSTAYTERLRIDSAGFVGIGIVPSRPLHVSFSSTSGPYLRVENPSTSGTTAAAGWEFFTHNGTASASQGVAFATANTWTFGGYGANSMNYLGSGTGGTNLMATNAAGVIRFFTAGELAANERLRIDSSGLIGIATASPATTLDVNGTFSIRSSDNAQTGATVTLTAPTTSTVRLTAATLTSVSGIAGGTNGEKVTLLNKTGASIAINHEDAGATAANRIISGTGASFNLPNNGSIDVIYDSTASRWTVVGGTGAGNLVVTLTAGEALSANDAVYVSVGAADGGRTAGRAYKIDATNDNRIEFVGFAITSASAGSSVSIQAGGGLIGFSGLTTGRQIFASVTTPGATQSSSPTLAGQWIVPLGIATSASTVAVNAAGSATAVKITSEADPFVYASVIQVNGTNQTLTTGNTVVLVYTGGTNRTITLPAPTAGKIVHIKKCDATVATVTISAPSGTIDGTASKVLLSQYDSLTIVSDGTDFFII